MYYGVIPIRSITQYWSGGFCVCFLKNDTTVWIVFDWGFFFFQYLFTWVLMIFCCGTQTLYLPHVGLVAPQHVESQFPNQGLNPCPPSPPIWRKTPIIRRSLGLVEMGKLGYSLSGPCLGRKWRKNLLESFLSIFPSLCLLRFGPLSQQLVSELSFPFPSIRIFSNESALRMRWPKYWIFSFSISPSNEYSGLISLRIDWFDLLAVQRTLKSLLHHHNQKISMDMWIFFSTYVLQYYTSHSWLNLRM